MKKKIKYRNESIGPLRIVKDFLPPPEDLAFKEDTAKVTISLSRTSVAFFKKEAKARGVRYQKMIRRLLDHYVARYAA